MLDWSYAKFVSRCSYNDLMEDFTQYSHRMTHQLFIKDLVVSKVRLPNEIRVNSNFNDLRATRKIVY